MLRNLLRNIVVGATTSGVSGDRKESANEVHAKTSIVVERHQYQESIELLNAMRRVGGVRRIGKGVGDAGAPVGQISERVLRHTDFGSLNDRIVSGRDETLFTPNWGQFGPAEMRDHPMQRQQYRTLEETQSAISNVKRPQNVRTLQDDLFGS